MPSEKKTRAVESIWQGGLRCEVTTGDFVIAVDEPVDVGGTETGPMPTELLLASVASCFTLAVAYNAKKLSIALDNLAVSVTGIYEGPRFSEIRITAKLGCDPAHVEALVLRAERTCYVANTLRSRPNIVVNAASVVAYRR
ncbi:OsmC family peroxiredoxin [Ensifer adhaerens]|uniref:OsmC family protein n=1 Tax=Ensifer canadensis TaxID=555315 RepID=UPI00148FEBF1|nr:OsmC family peroxiredoxin [Ensifer canadensis]